MDGGLGLQRLAARQDAVVSRAQVLSLGVSWGSIRENLDRGRWQVVHAGVYATFSGPLPRRAQLWAAVLAAGDRALLSHETAAELHGLTDHPTTRIHVTLPHTQRQARLGGVHLHRRRHLEAVARPDRSPPRTAVEETVVDLTQSARSLTDACGWIARGVNNGLTTVERLRDELMCRRRVRWRTLLVEGLGFVAVGCRSVLEITYLRDVERAHGLPAGERQVRVPVAGRFDFLDVLYRRQHVRVELDGRAAHPPDRAHRDLARDNAAVLAGDDPLRYGTANVVDDPCLVAAQVAKLLRDNGFTGPLQRCGRPGCPVTP